MRSVSIAEITKTHFRLFCGHRLPAIPNLKDISCVTADDKSAVVSYRVSNRHHHHCAGLYICIHIIQICQSLQSPTPAAQLQHTWRAQLCPRLDKRCCAPAFRDTTPFTGWCLPKNAKALIWKTGRQLSLEAVNSANFQSKYYLTYIVADAGSSLRLWRPAERGASGCWTLTTTLSSGIEPRGKLSDVQVHVTAISWTCWHD